MKSNVLQGYYDDVTKSDLSDVSGVSLACYE